MGKPTICIGENKGADQLRSNCEADQRLCFRYMDSTIPLLSKSKNSRLQPSSVLVQLGLCQTWSETTLFFFHEVAQMCTPFDLSVCMLVNIRWCFLLGRAFDLRW